MQLKTIIFSVGVFLSFASTLNSQTIPNYVPTNNLIAWYPFNGNANDESGNGNNGTLSGATLVHDRIGSPNSACGFNGINMNVIIPYDSTLNPGLPFSISFYGRSLDPTSQQTWISTSPYGDALGWNVMVNQNGGMKYEIDLDNNWNSYVNNYNFPLSTWVHYAYVFTNSEIRVYVNGALLESNPIPIGSVSYNMDSLAFGSTTEGLNPLLGYIDDIGLWSRALTPCEIKDLYYSGVNPITIDFAPQLNFVNIATGGVASASDNWGSDVAANAFDGDSFNYSWASDCNLPYGSNGPGTPVWLQYDFGPSNPKVVSSYRMISSSNNTNGWDAPEYNPYKWSFQGFDGLNWIVLDTRIDANQSLDIWKQYNFSNSTAYQAYRICSTDSSSSCYMRITELEMGVRSLTSCSGQQVTFYASEGSAYAYNWSTGETTTVITVNPTSTTTYTLTATDADGCVSQDTINVIINNSDTTISISALDSFTLNATTYTQSGTYTQVIPNAAGCDSTITLNLTINYTGLNESTNSGLSISPNPAHDEITIKSDDITSSDSFEITDMSGKVILFGALNAQISTIGLLDLVPGIYFLHLQIGDSKEVIRFLKE